MIVRIFIAPVSGPCEATWQQASIPYALRALRRALR